MCFRQWPVPSRSSVEVSGLRLAAAIWTEKGFSRILLDVGGQ